MIGVYYLHTNGDLIFKPAAVFVNTTPAEYMDSTFVVKWWEIPDKAPTPTDGGNVMWIMDLLREAYELSNNKARTAERIFNICGRHGFPDIIPRAIIKGKKAQDGALAALAIQIDKETKA